MVTEDNPAVAHTMNGVKLEAVMSEGQVVLMAESLKTTRAYVLAPDHAEKLGRALWDLGRED